MSLLYQKVLSFISKHWNLEVNFLKPLNLLGDIGSLGQDFKTSRFNCTQLPQNVLEYSRLRSSNISDYTVPTHTFIIFFRNLV